jgi:hypothetical protein
VLFLALTILFVLLIMPLSGRRRRRRRRREVYVEGYE